MHLVLVINQQDQHKQAQRQVHSHKQQVQQLLAHNQQAHLLAAAQRNLIHQF
jgi:hypothetical protein